MAAADGVNSVATTLPSASARRIVEVAERLFALHGIDGVSLRQIAAAAGTANNSAVNYHFGSKEGLIAAIFQYRLPQLTSERKMLAARCDPDDLRSRFEAYYLPVLHIAEATDNHYVSFVEQLQRRWVGSGASAASTGMLPNLPTEGQHSIEDFRSDLERLLPHLNMPLRRIRIATAMSTSLYAAADRERAVAGDVERPPFELFVSALLDGIVGFLEAPVSDATAKWLGRAGDVATHRHHVL